MTALRLNVIITEQNNKPCLILRRKITDIKIIQAVTQAAYQDRIINVLPQFDDKLQSTASMIKKGIIYYDTEKKKYLFTI